MNTQVEPKLRHVDKTHAQYPLNCFPAHFAKSLGKELLFLLATRRLPRLEGTDWEEIFARCIGAHWTPSNVGLDDVSIGTMAWGAKTVKNRKPFDVSHVRLISGRNSPAYSFGIRNIDKLGNDQLGECILKIWNARVKEVRGKFQQLRTVVLIKSDDLLQTSAFEFEAVMYPPEAFYWQWNDKDNLEGYEKGSNAHRFTWQPHGSQFTIIESVPEKRLKLQLAEPPQVDLNAVLQNIGFDESWIHVVP